MKDTFKTYTAKFLMNDTDDELMKDIGEDEVYLDLSKVIAFFPSEYEGFIKVELVSGNYYTIKEERWRFKDDVKYAKE